MEKNIQIKYVMDKITFMTLTTSQPVGIFIKKNIDRLTNTVLLYLATI